MHDEHEHDQHDHDHHHQHDHDHHLHLNPGDFAAAKPILNVRDCAASLKYYVETLGFELVFAWCDADQPQAPTFGEVRRGAAAIMLAQNGQGRGETWIYLDVQSPAELDALHADYQRRGARLAAVPENKPWNMREMLVRDLDGHVLRLGAPLGHHD